MIEQCSIKCIIILWLTWTIHLQFFSGPVPLVARSLAEPVSFSLPSDGIRSPGKNVSSCPDQNAKDSPKKSEVECTSGAHKGQLVVSDKVLPINSHLMKEMHEPPPAAVVFSGISAVPESEFIWKYGSFLCFSSYSPLFDILTISELEFFWASFLSICTS